MAIFDDIRQWWTRLAERERRLIVMLGVAGIVCVFGFVGLIIRNGLADMEEKNSEMRGALRLMTSEHDRYLEELARADTSVVAQIGREAPPLASYLESIANDVGVTIPESNERPATNKGKFQEKTVEIALRSISIDKLAEFLKQIETRSPIVVTQRLHVKTRFNQPDMLDVELTVATYQLAAPKEQKEKGGTAGEGTKEAKDKENEI